MNAFETQENIVRASDILEQITKLNEMIDFHKNESGELSMMQQYELMREDFLNELVQILNEFKINVKFIGMAA